MKVSKATTTSIFLFTVILLIMRPFIVFSSSTIQEAYCKEAKVFGLVKTVRKRKENFASVLLYKEEEKPFRHFAFLGALLIFLCKWQRKAIELLSYFLAGLHFLLKRRHTFFEINPLNDYFLSLSVLRI